MYVHTLAYAHIRINIQLSSSFTHIGTRGERLLSTNDLSDLAKSLYQVRTKWYSLGKQLGINISSLDAIQKEHSTDVASCFRVMLLKRLRTGLTWKQIIGALKANAVRENSLAEKFSQQYLSTVQGALLCSV